MGDSFDWLLVIIAGLVAIFTFFVFAFYVKIAATRDRIAESTWHIVISLVFLEFLTAILQENSNWFPRIMVIMTSLIYATVIYNLTFSPAMAAVLHQRLKDRFAENIWWTISYLAIGIVAIVLRPAFPLALYRAAYWLCTTSIFCSDLLLSFRIKFLCDKRQNLVNQTQ